MAVCDFCGKRMGFTDANYGYNNATICDSCNRAKNNILKNLYPSTINDNLSFFMECIESNNCSLAGKAAIIKLLSETTIYNTRLAQRYEEIKNREERIIELNEEFQKNKEELIKSFKMTTGFNFEKYEIVKYIDIISGEVVLGTGFFSELSAQVNDFFGSTSATFEGKLSKAKSEAQKNLKNKALSLGANAVIGVDFDITTFSNNIIAVSVNGTAVVIKKISE